jgi:hypothetical protein
VEINRAQLPPGPSNQDPHPCSSIIGGLAVMTGRETSFRPIALRPRLSTGLPFSVNMSLAGIFIFVNKQIVIWDFRNN